MKLGRRIVMYILWIALGTALVVLGVFNKVDSFWSGMGSALIAVSILRLVQMLRLRSDSYREAVEIEANDERNRFLRNKAWAWAGYLFIMIAAAATIVLRVVGQDLLSMAASGAVCLMVVLYWVSYLILRKKY